MPIHALCCRLGACVVLVALGAAAAPVATGTTLQPTEDGMSLPGMMMARMNRMHMQHMSQHKDGSYVRTCLVSSVLLIC